MERSNQEDNNAGTRLATEALDALDFGDSSERAASSRSSTQSVLASWKEIAMSGSETCSVDATGKVTCTLSSGASSIDLSTVLSDAQALNSAITSGSAIVITAFGGSGGDGHDEPVGRGGSGGSAQMVTTLAALSSRYGTTKIYYYLGSQGSTEHPGGKGGASTIV